MDTEDDFILLEDDGGSHIPGSLILMVIAIGFVVGSFFMFWMAVGPLVKSYEARNWELGGGIIVSSVVHEVDRNQYIIDAKYDYVWKGQRYQSTEVFFDETVGLRKNYYHQISRELLQHTTSSNPIEIRINPKNPEQAIIYPQIRWDKFAANLLLFSIWLAIATFLVTASILILRDWFSDKRIVTLDSNNLKTGIY